jgi:hypothetical protein
MQSFILENIAARPHPSGNRIDLQWINPHVEEYPGVCVLRREGIHPAYPTDGVLVMERNAFLFSLASSFISELDYQNFTSPLRQIFLDHSIGLSSSTKVIIETVGDKWKIVNQEYEYIIKKSNGNLNVFDGNRVSVIDNNLKGETVYYYTLFLFRGNPREYKFDPHNRVSAMASDQYNFAGQMMDLLPAIYHRYDTVLPKNIPPLMLEEDKQKGQLRRFLDLPGCELDLIRSLAEAMLNLYNLDRVDGRLLDLLAQWIGWKTNYKWEIAAQRNEIKNAPFIYQRVGIIHAIEATVKRTIGWESRTKEFVYNVFISNNPEKLTLWIKERKSSTWSETKDPLSIDWAFEGRPSAVRKSDKDIRLFYHTLRNNCWNIMSKQCVAFSIESEFEAELDKLVVSLNLRERFKDNGYSLSSQATVDKKDGSWVIKDFQKYAVEKGSDVLNVTTWEPSEPITQGNGFNKHPVSVFWKNTFWVFWNSFDEAEKRWSIQCCTFDNGNWSAYNNIPDNSRERKRPSAVVDNNGTLWLFWQEKAGNHWQFKYSSTHNGHTWGPIQIFPANNVGDDPRVETDPFVLFYMRIWVFWTRKEFVSGSKNKRWKIYYRRKASANSWNNFRALEIAGKDYDDCAPSAFINDNGKLELFWSSNRDGSWSIWSAVYNGTKWSTATKVTEGPYSQRDPLPVLTGNSSLLFYRSNQSVPYSSNVYGATETADFRYAGSTSFNTQDQLKNDLWEQFEDFQTYTYDTGKADEDWYARDTAGVFLKVGTDDQTLINSNVETIRNLLKEFLPIQIRPVFFIETPLYEEIVYAQGLPVDIFSDNISDSMSEQKYNPIGDLHEDSVPGWAWMLTADCTQRKYFDNDTVNFSVLPISTKFRTWHSGLT